MRTKSSPSRLDPLLDLGHRERAVAAGEAGQRAGAGPGASAGAQGISVVADAGADTAAALRAPIAEEQGDDPLRAGPAGIQAGPWRRDRPALLEADMVAVRKIARAGESARG